MIRVLYDALQSHIIMEVQNNCAKENLELTMSHESNTDLLVDVNDSYHDILIKLKNCDHMSIAASIISKWKNVTPNTAKAYIKIRSLTFFINGFFRGFSRMKEKGKEAISLKSVKHIL